MALLLRYKDDFAAHLARSKLLAHGIAAAVLHDNAATLYGNWVTRPRLLVADADLEMATSILVAPDSPIEDDFVQPADLAANSEDFGLHCALPGFFELIVFGAIVAGCLGVVVVAMITTLTIMNAAALLQELRMPVLLLPVAFAAVGAAEGAVIWPAIVFARSCRRNERGELPLRARLVALLLLVG